MSASQLAMFVSPATLATLGVCAGLFPVMAVLWWRERAERRGRQSQGNAAAEDALRARLLGDIRSEFFQSRQELAESVARGQSAVAERFQGILQDVQLSLGETERRWGEVQRLGDTVARLKDIFEKPASRGRILGEVTLERLLADCLPPGYFAFQHPIGTLRVDAVVKFPHAGMVIPIDSKFPETGDATTLVRLAREIAAKYVRPDLGTTPFAYLYLPNESLWQEAVGAPRVWDECVALRVYPVSPHTLAIALHGAAQGAHAFERGLKARDALELLEGHLGTLGGARAALAEGVVCVQKAATAFARAESDLATLEARIASGLEAREASLRTRPEEQSLASPQGDGRQAAFS